MSRFIFGVAALCVALVVALALSHQSTRLAIAAAPSAPSTASPVVGFTLHIDASQHYANHPDEIIHHWCRTYSPSLIECLLFDADGPNGHEVGVETIVPVSVWKTYSATERALWHYHKVEIPKLKYAKLPGLTKAQADKVIASLMETYGKVWILWDPLGTNGQPIGEPTITILK